MTMVSYAQNHEDVLLDRAFPRGHAGFYIDVGANDPVVNSVTKHFYDLGWRGINIEPLPAQFEALQAARERDVNLNIGLSDSAGEATFYEFPPELNAISTFSAEEAERHAGNGQPSFARTVATRTLAQVCTEHASGAIDFLSIDVEGHEQAVLSGNDWERWRPRVILVEATQPATTVPVHERWEPILLEAGYLFATFDGLNRYYVRPEDAELKEALAVPVNVTDDYIPHGLNKVIHELKWTSDHVARQLAASRLANSTLSDETAALAAEVASLRDAYQQVERALAAARQSCDEVRHASEAARRRADELSAELAEVREAALRGGVIGAGPTAVRLAQRLTEVSTRYPSAAASAKKIVRMGLKATRAVSPGGEGSS